MKKNSFKTHISHYWFIYIAVAIVSAILWSTIVTFWTRDKKKEVVTVWAMAYNAKIAQITEKLETNRPDYLKHVRFTYSDYDNELASMSYNGLGAAYDIAILPETFLDKIAVEKTYSVLDENYLTENIGVLSYYEKDSNKLGIKIFDKNGEDTGLISYTKEGIENQNFYVFLSKKSLHMGKINGSEHDGGIKVLKTILEEL